MRDRETLSAQVTKLKGEVTNITQLRTTDLSEWKKKEDREKEERERQAQQRETDAKQVNELSETEKGYLQTKVTALMKKVCNMNSNATAEREALRERENEQNKSSHKLLAATTKLNAVQLSKLKETSKLLERENAELRHQINESSQARDSLNKSVLLWESSSPRTLVLKILKFHTKFMEFIRESRNHFTVTVTVNERADLTWASGVIKSSDSTPNFNRAISIIYDTISGDEVSLSELQLSLNSQKKSALRRMRLELVVQEALRTADKTDDVTDESGSPIEEVVTKPISPLSKAVVPMASIVVGDSLDSLNKDKRGQQLIKSKNSSVSPTRHSRKGKGSRPATAGRLPWPFAQTEISNSDSHPIRPASAMVGPIPDFSQLGTRLGSPSSRKTTTAVSRSVELKTQTLGLGLGHGLGRSAIPRMQPPIPSVGRVHIFDPHFSRNPKRGIGLPPYATSSIPAS